MGWADCLQQMCLVTERLKKPLVAFHDGYVSENECVDCLFGATLTKENACDE